jgi:glycogenin
LHEVHKNAPSPPELPFSTVCLVTPETVDVSSLRALRQVFDLVVGVEIISQIEKGNGLQLLGKSFSPQFVSSLIVVRVLTSRDVQVDPTCIRF